MSEMTHKTLTSFRQGFDQNEETNLDGKITYYRIYKAYVDILLEGSGEASYFYMSGVGDRVGQVLDASLIKFRIDEVETDAASISNFRVIGSTGNERAGLTRAWLDSRNLVYDKNSFGKAGIIESYKILGEEEKLTENGWRAIDE